MPAKIFLDHLRDADLAAALSVEHPAQGEGFQATGHDPCSQDSGHLRTPRHFFPGLFFVCPDLFFGLASLHRHADAVHPDGAQTVQFLGNRRNLGSFPRSLGRFQGDPQLARQSHGPGSPRPQIAGTMVMPLPVTVRPKTAGWWPEKLSAR